MAKVKNKPLALRRKLDELDAARWRFCMKHGFPRKSFNPEIGRSYWYVPGDHVIAPACYEWKSEAQAVDAAMLAIDSSPERKS